MRHIIVTYSLTCPRHAEWRREWCWECASWSSAPESKDSCWVPRLQSGTFLIHQVRCTPCMDIKRGIYRITMVVWWMSLVSPCMLSFYGASMRWVPFFWHFTQPSHQYIINSTESIQRRKTEAELFWVVSKQIICGLNQNILFCAIKVICTHENHMKLDTQLIVHMSW